jgi:hypothetical protein
MDMGYPMLRRDPAGSTDMMMVDWQGTLVHPQGLTFRHQMRKGAGIQGRRCVAPFHFSRLLEGTGHGEASHSEDQIAQHR